MSCENALVNRFEPYVFLRDLASRWDVLAFIVVIGLIVFLGETSRGLSHHWLSCNQRRCHSIHRTCPNMQPAPRFACSRPYSCPWCSR